MHRSDHRASSCFGFLLEDRWEVQHSLALQNFGEYQPTFDEHSFPHPLHSRLNQEQLLEHHCDLTGKQHNRKTGIFRLSQTIAVKQRNQKGGNGSCFQISTLASPLFHCLLMISFGRILEQCLLFDFYCLVGL